MKSILLDLDRTLVDLQSFTDYDAAWAELADLVGPSYGEGLGPETDWSSATRACMHVIATLSDETQWQQASALIERHELAAIEQSVAMPGLAEFVALLGARPRAVVTLLPETVAREVLRLHGVPTDVVVGRDPRVRPKPSGDGLLRALDLLGLPASGATMVGDSTWDALAAADAGVEFIGVHAGASEFASIDPRPPVCRTLREVAQLL